MYPVNCSLQCRRTLYMKYDNVTACMKYFYKCNIALKPEKLSWILYHENKHKLTKWFMQKCAS